jgi:hypothetical protein
MHNVYKDPIVYCIQRLCCCQFNVFWNQSIINQFEAYNSMSQVQYFFKSASHYGRCVELTSDKLPMREGRSLLRYTNCGVCISLIKKSLSSWGEFGFPFLSWTNISSQNKLLAQSHKKYLSCRHFGRHHLLIVGLRYKGLADKLLHLNNEIVKTLCPLDQQPLYECPLFTLSNAIKPKYSCGFFDHINT